MAALELLGPDFPRVPFELNLMDPRQQRKTQPCGRKRMLVERHPFWLCLQLLGFFVDSEQAPCFVCRLSWYRLLLTCIAGRHLINLLLTLVATEASKGFQQFQNRVGAPSLS